MTLEIREVRHDGTVQGITHSTAYHHRIDHSPESVMAGWFGYCDRSWTYARAMFEYEHGKNVARLELVRDGEVISTYAKPA